MAKINSLLEHITFLARHLKGCETKCAVNAMLIELDVPVETLGFGYLIKAIILFVEDCTRLLYKDVYPTVAKTASSAPSAESVETEISSAVKKGWQYGDLEMWEIYFPSTEEPKKAPSNKKFIMKLARVIELWEGICKAMEKEQSKVMETQY